MIQVQINWQNQMVTALGNSGFNVSRLSDVALVDHVTNLHSMLEENRIVQEELRTSLDEMDRQCQIDLEWARYGRQRAVEEHSREKERLVFENDALKLQLEKVMFEQEKKERFHLGRITTVRLEEHLSFLQMVLQREKNLARKLAEMGTRESTKSLLHEKHDLQGAEYLPVISAHSHSGPTDYCSQESPQTGAGDHVAEM